MYDTIDAQEWLDYWFPKDGVCPVDDSGIINRGGYSNQGRRRSEVINLFVSGYDYELKRESYDWDKLTGKLDLSDFTNLEWLICSYNQLTELILPSGSSLVTLNCGYNQMTSLDLSSFSNLKELSCAYNRLTSLIIPKEGKLVGLRCENNNLSILDLGNNYYLERLNCERNQLVKLSLPASNKLVKVIAYNNFLNTLSYDSLNPATLKGLNLGNNNFEPTDISVFSNFTNLTFFMIGNDAGRMKTDKYNRFYGSLESLKNCNFIESLSFRNTDVDSGLEYLDSKLRDVNLSLKIRRNQNIDIFGCNIAVWQSYHSDLMIRVGRNPVEIDYNRLETVKNFSNVFNRGMIEQCNSLVDLIGSKEKFDNDQRFNYSSFMLRDFHPFNWENNENLDSKPLPIRLYHIPTNQVIDSELISVNSNYAILSYVWGDLSDKDNLTTWDYVYLKKDGSTESKQIGVNKKFGAIGTTKESIVALRKAIATIEFLNRGLPTEDKIEYLWMDQICINQFDHKEQEREVPKMKQYYSNASAALVSIERYLTESLIDYSENDGEKERLLYYLIVSQIVRSPWFHRSWTFQEGVLSKQTIFMFDNELVDGRMLALGWGGEQGAYKSIPSIFITPFGWSYNVNNYLTVDLTISEILTSVNHRHQSVLVDKVYSILGLLPYGDKIKVEYKPWGQKYTKEELENKLSELVEQAYLYNPKDIITYLGERSLNNWWLPFVNDNGSLNVYGSLYKGDQYGKYALSKIENITRQGVQLLGHYTDLSDCFIVEIDKNDKYTNTIWLETVQFAIPKSNAPIKIIRTENTYYSRGNEQQEIFIDMINREVILKSDQDDKYRELVYQPLIEYLKGGRELDNCVIEKYLCERKIDLSNLNFSGLLDISGFTNLRVFSCDKNDLTKLILPDSDLVTSISCCENKIDELILPGTCHDLEMLACYRNNLTFIDVNNFSYLRWFFVSENRLSNLDVSHNKELFTLHCSKNRLANLDLSNNLNLNTLHCENNNLKELNLIDNSNLVELRCSGNKLKSLIFPECNRLVTIEANGCEISSFNYSILNINNMRLLNLLDNNLPRTDVKVFSNLINLEQIHIGNRNGYLIKQNFYNRFYGSLESWSNLTKLFLIDISNTDINDGVKSLPNSLEEIHYSTKERPDCKLKEIELQIKEFIESRDSFQAISNERESDLDFQIEQLNINN